MASRCLPPVLSFLKTPLAVARPKHAVFIVVDTEYYGVRISVMAAPIPIVRSKEHGSLNGHPRGERMNQLIETLITGGVAVVVFWIFCRFAVSAAKQPPHAIQFGDVQRLLWRAPTLLK